MYYASFSKSGSSCWVPCIKHLSIKEESSKVLTLSYLKLCNKHVKTESTMFRLYNHFESLGQTSKLAAFIDKPEIWAQPPKPTPLSLGLDCQTPKKDKLSTQVFLRRV
jgi:hypothetical protein